MGRCAVCWGSEPAGCACEAADSSLSPFDALEEDGSLAADEELRPVTALFADIAGSTSLGERLAPHLVRLVIGDCVSDLTGIVERLDGCVTAHMGDGIAAFFGLHGAHEDDPQRAAIAALEMVRSAQGFARDIASAWETEDFAIRVGINAGRVATTRIGAADPAKHALGDPVNVAARLQAVAPRNGVLVGREAVAQLDERFDLEQLPPFQVRGRDEEVSAWELHSFDPSAKRDLAVVPLVGREVECLALESVVEDVVAGRGRVLLLTGEAGIGKSRLLAEFRRMVGPDALWLEASCAGQGVAVPFKPIGDLIRQWIGLGYDVPSLAVRVSLQHALKGLGLTDAEEVLAGFEWLLGAREGERDLLRWDEQRSPEAIQTEMRESVCRWLGRLTVEGPVVIALEDAEQVDASTRSMIEDVMDLTDGDGLSLAVAMRPDSYSEGWGIRVQALAEYAHRAREVSVLPLTSSATDDLVTILDQSGHLTEGMRGRLVRTAEGNPLFAEELYRSIVEEGGPDEFCENGDGLPIGLEGLLLARIDRLDAETRIVAQCAAAIGRVFSSHLVADTLGSISIGKSIKELVRSGIITEEMRYPEARYTFRHGLFRDAALSTLLPEHRRDLHRRIASVIERSSEDGKDLEALAHHCALGELWGRAAQCFLLAAERAIRLDAVQEGMNLLRQAWEAARAGGASETVLRVGTRLAELLVETGQPDAAVNVYERMLDLVRRDMSGGVYGALAECLADIGRINEAKGAIKEANRTVCLRRDPYVLYAMAHVAFREGMCEGAAEELKGLERQRASGDAWNVDLDGKVAWLWAGLCAVSGDFQSAEVWTAERRQRAAESGEVVRVLEADRDLGILALCRGDIARSREKLESTFERANGLGYFKHKCEATVNLLYLYWLSGDLNKGKEFAERVECWERIPHCRAEVLGGVAGISVGLGAFDKAERVYEEGLECGGDAWVSLALRLRLSLVRLARGDLEGAEGGIRAVLGKLGRSGVRLEQRSWARVGLAEIAMERGDGETAEREALLALKDAERAERPAVVAPRRVLGMARELQEAGSGRGDLERALVLARDMGMRLEEGRALAALARFGLGESRDLRGEARRLFEGCGARPDLVALDAEEDASGARMG